MNVKISKEESTVLKAVSILTVIFTHANGAEAFVDIPVLRNSVFTSLLCQGGMCTFFHESKRFTQNNLPLSSSQSKFLSAPPLTTTVVYDFLNRFFYTHYLLQSICFLVFSKASNIIIRLI